MAANETSPWMAPELEFDESVPAEKVGAFFDIDETLVRGATAYWAAKEMFRRSVVATPSTTSFLVKASNTRSLR